MSSSQRDLSGENFPKARFTQESINDAKELDPNPTLLPNEVLLGDSMELPLEISPQVTYLSPEWAYEDLSAELIKDIKTKYQLDINSTTFYIHGRHIWRNLAWSEEEIETLSITMDTLPAPYFFDNERSPQEVFLIKRPMTDFDDLEGGYANRKIFLKIPQIFYLDSPIPAPTGAFIKNYKDYLQVVIGHEWTHSFTESHPELVDQWAQRTGWYKKADGSWRNDNYWVIFPDIEVLKNPVEDIATSVGLMLVSPEVLTQDRTFP